MKRVVFFLLIVFTACKSTELRTDEAVMIFMKKTTCMGECPVYELRIFSDGFVSIDAKQYLPIEGRFDAMLSSEQLTELSAAFDESNFFTYEKSYTSNMSDLPTTTLSYRRGGKSHTVVDYDGAPESLKALEARVHRLVESLDWKRKK